jgi:glycosyltransferase involved in cell wall biosynthesis
MKEKLGWGGRFIFGTVSRPNPRKHFERMFQAYGRLLERDPEARDKTGLYLHMDLSDPMCPKNFMEMLNIYGIADNVKITNHPYLSGIPAEELNRIYNLFDMQTLATGGEGFGVITIEAMGTETPTMITDYTTSREILRGGACGMLVPTEKIVMENSGVRKAWVDIDAMSEAMEFAYQNPDIIQKYINNIKQVAPYYHFKNVVPRMENIILNNKGNIEPIRFTPEEVEQVGDN